MTRDEIAGFMAEACGLYWGDEAHFQRFAALVAAAERERLKQSIRHSLTIGPKTIQTRVYFGEVEVSIVKMPIEEVVAAEREACAKVCESEGSRVDASWASCAAAIRARGQA